MSKIMICYLVAVNMIGLIIMAVDKEKARKHRWRIPEKTLFLIALLGGSVGSLAGMYLFRHKTKHLSFVIGMPLILILQVAVALYMGIG